MKLTLKLNPGFGRHRFITPDYAFYDSWLFPCTEELSVVERLLSNIHCPSIIIEPTRCTNLSQFYFGMKFYVFRTVPLSIIRSFSLYAQQWYMSYMLADSLRAGNLFLERNSTCFGQFLCPSSGVFRCTHSNGICHTCLLTACEQAQPARKLSANM